MPNVGIIAEFDPLHRGHEALLAYARTLAGADGAVICAMSGNVTQRGEFACVGKHARAEMALKLGADLIVELPVFWACASAERFARGGVELLSHAGCDTLLFGSECGDIAALRSVADALDSAEFSAAVRQGLDAGRSFAEARQTAVTALIGENGTLLGSPNNLLGVEYLRALAYFGLDWQVFTLSRTVSNHHDSTLSGYAASPIRALIRDGNTQEALCALPDTSARILQNQAERGLVGAALCNAQRAVLYRLKTMEESDFAALPDCAEGLEHRLLRASRQALSLQAFYDLARTRRYPLARIRRMTLCAFLGITNEDLPKQVPYVRILGFSMRGTRLLSAMRKSPVPVLTKPAAAKTLSPQGQAVFAAEVRATELRSLCLPQLGHHPTEWEVSPVRSESV